MRKNRKLISIIITLAMLVSFITPAFAVPADVVGSPYAAAIEKMTDLGVFQGFEDGTFRPDATMNRAQAAKILAFLIGKGADVNERDATVTTQFADVPTGHWAAGYINICAAEGIYEGYPDGTFQPTNAVTQRELATLMLRALGHDPDWDEVDAKANEVGIITWTFNSTL